MQPPSLMFFFACVKKHILTGPLAILVACCLSVIEFAADNMTKQHIAEAVVGNVTFGSLVALGPILV